MRRYPGGGAFALFFHPHPREFATQDKKCANARGLARGRGWAQLELTDALHLFKSRVTQKPLHHPAITICKHITVSRMCKMHIQQHPTQTFRKHNSK